MQAHYQQQELNLSAGIVLHSGASISWCGRQGKANRYGPVAPTHMELGKSFNEFYTVLSMVPIIFMQYQVEVAD